MSSRPIRMHKELKRSAKYKYKCKYKCLRFKQFSESSAIFHSILLFLNSVIILTATFAKVIFEKKMIKYLGNKHVKDKYLRLIVKFNLCRRIFKMDLIGIYINILLCKQFW